MSLYYIYKITNNINNKIYIGQHKVRENETLRSYMGKGVALREAYKKYGIHNFSKEIIEYIEDDDKHLKVSEREIYWINTLNSLSPNGYNISPGGEGGVTSEIARKSAATRKANGYVVSHETREKISKSKLGKKFSEEHKKHLSEHHHLKKTYWIIFEDGHEEEISSSLDNICALFNIKSKNTLIRHSAKKVFTNGIMLKDLDPSQYACCGGANNNRTFYKKKKAEDYKYKDPFTGEIITYHAFINRRKRNSEYKQYSIKESRVEEEYEI